MRSELELGFTIIQDFQNSSIFQKRGTTKYSAVELGLISTQTFLHATINVGSNKQPITLMLDTGSDSTLIISDEVVCFQAEGTEIDSRLARRRDFGENVQNSLTDVDQGNFNQEIDSQNCKRYGAFDSLGSTSYEEIYHPASFSIIFQDDTFASGNWAQDSLFFGNVEVSRMPFVLVNKTNNIIGLLGLGIGNLKAENENIPSSFQSFPQVLKTQNIIKRAVFSLYLDQSQNQGSVLFGAVDHAKYEGVLKTIPLTNFYVKYSKQPLFFDISLDSILITLQTKEKLHFPVDRSALLDTGSTLCAFSKDILFPLAETLGGKWQESVKFFEIDPDSVRSTDIQFFFSSTEITVPVSSILFAMNGKHYLGISLVDHDRFVLGINFLRHAYVVFDTDKNQVSMAQRRDSLERNVETVIDGVPRAVPAYKFGKSILKSEKVKKKDGKEGSVSFKDEVEIYEYEKEDESSETSTTHFSTETRSDTFRESVYYETSVSNSSQILEFTHTVLETLFETQKPEDSFDSSVSTIEKISLDTAIAKGIVVDLTSSPLSQISFLSQNEQIGLTSSQNIEEDAITLDEIDQIVKILDEEEADESQAKLMEIVDKAITSNDHFLRIYAELVDAGAILDNDYHIRNQRGSEFSEHFEALPNDLISSQSEMQNDTFINLNTEAGAFKQRNDSILTHHILAETNLSLCYTLSSEFHSLSAESIVSKESEKISKTMRFISSKTGSKSISLPDIPLVTESEEKIEGSNSSSDDFQENKTLSCQSNSDKILNFGGRLRIDPGLVECEIIIASNASTFDNTVTSESNKNLTANFKSFAFLANQSLEVGKQHFSCNFSLSGIAEDETSFGGERYSSQNSQNELSNSSRDSEISSFCDLNSSCSRYECSHWYFSSNYCTNSSEPSGNLQEYKIIANSHAIFNTDDHKTTFDTSTKSLSFSTHSAYVSEDSGNSPSQMYIRLRLLGAVVGGFIGVI